MAVDLSKYSPEAAAVIGNRLKQLEVTVAEFMCAVGKTVGIWYQWRNGSAKPADETWEKVVRVARRFGIK